MPNNELYTFIGDSSQTEAIENQGGATRFRRLPEAGKRNRHHAGRPV